MTFPNLPANALAAGAGIRKYVQPAPKVVGYALDDLWYIVEPPAVDISNLVTNPSIELATTGYFSNQGGTIARVATRQRRGAYCLECTPNAVVNDGVLYQSVSLVSGRLYYCSFDFLGTAGNNYEVMLTSTAFATVGNTTRFTATGYWQRIHHWYKETSSAARYIYILKRASANLNPFYIDGLMVAPVTSGDPLRYFDGDSVGYVPGRSDFYWASTPHGSISVMKANTRAGGYVKSLASYGFTLLAMLGLGLATPDNIAIPLVLPGGEQYQDTLAVARTFDLVGMLESASGRAELDRRHSALAAVLDARHRPYRQPLTLLHELVNECGDSISELVAIQASLAGGLEGSRDNNYREDLDLRFRIHVPYVAANVGTEGSALSVATTITNANYIIQRDRLGNYSALSGGANGQILSLMYANHILYASGLFASMDGLANTQGIAKWSGTAWSAMGTGANGIVRQTAADALGNIYAVGQFTLMGGVANTRLVAKWNGAAWSAMGTGATGGSDARAVLAGPDGRIYVGGNFTGLGGVANTAYIGAWTGSAWVSIGISAQPVTNMIFGADGNLYVAGPTTIGGVTVNGMAKYDLATGLWSSMGSGPSGGSINALAAASDGTIYAGGGFTSFDGVSANSLAAWNGYGWAALGTGLNAKTSSLYYDPITSNLYIGGIFTTAGGIPLPDHMVIWNGSTYLTMDVDLPGSADVSAWAVEPGTANLVMGYDTSGTATSASASTILTNSGSTDSFPIIKFVADLTSGGRLEIFQIANQTTGEVVYFDGLTLIAGETTTIDWTPGRKTITSDFRGDMSYTVAPGSNMATFHLAPGANLITVYQQVYTGLNPTASAFWYPAYADLDDTVR